MRKHGRNMVQAMALAVAATGMSFGGVLALESTAGADTRPAAEASCTDRINYAGDKRSNAEIDSIGERTGSCPLPRPVTKTERCTDIYDYTGDRRSNAVINGIGHRSGSCPLAE